MSYTLRGRLETRAAVLVPVLLGACLIAALLEEWWPLELAALMVGLALVLDLVYHRLLPYQPGWVAVPLGLLELGLLVVLTRDAGIDAPIGWAIALFAGAWLFGQVLVHAVLPLGRLSYAEDGGELGRVGPVLAVAATVVLAAAGGFAWSTRPPVVHLASGEHVGPIVLDHRQKLVGDDDTIVRGGIRITADDVTVENVTVIGGDYGFDVDDAKDVVLEDVTVLNAKLDGIHVRHSEVHIKDCRVLSPPAPYTQGIDISFSFDLDESMVEGCTIEGGAEGIVTNSANATLMGNRVSRTTLRAIDMTEMSMGMIENNRVIDTLGIAIFCGDHSECMVEKNTVVATRPDAASDDLTREGYGIVAHYGAVAELGENSFAQSRGAAAFAEGRLVSRR